MFKKTILSILLLGALSIYAQVGIGTTTPNANALLEIDATTTAGGLLLPRLALTGTTNTAPLAAHVAGMTVYNTATAADVVPGFYFNNGTRWIRLEAASNDWKLSGNTATIPGTGVNQNFIGTTDAQNLIIATNGGERIRVLTTGQVSVNDNTPFLIDRFTVQGQNGEYAINGYSLTNGTGIYGENTGTGFGVEGWNNNSAGLGMVATNTNAAGVGIVGSGAGAGIARLAGTGGTFNGSIGAAGFSTSATGTGITGTGNNGNIAVLNPNGGGIAGSGTRNGVFGYAGNGGVLTENRGNAGGIFVLDADNDPTTITGNNGNRASAILAGFDRAQPGSTDTARNSYFGGYFSGGSQSSGTPTYAYVGMRYRTNANGDGVNIDGLSSSGQDYKIIGTGLVSTLIYDTQGTPRIMFAPEAPEIVFQDFGIGKLVNGQTRIELDPILKQSLQIDKNNPLKVYVTLEGECNGVFVTNKTADGFTVKELNGGTSNVEFSWQIVASRADTKDTNGNITSKHVGLRLPVGPGPLAETQGIVMETKELKTQNKAPETKGKVKEPLN